MVRPKAELYFGFAFASLLLAGLSIRFALVSMAFAFGAIVFALEGIRSLRKDPYDLSELRRIHEAAELEENHDVFCPHCAEVYPSNYPVCPHCRRSVNH